MFGSFELSDFIAYRVSVCDYKCRLELQRGAIVDEPDYVSCLSKTIRDDVKHIKMKVHAQTLSGGQEQNNGADGIIIFQIKNEIKVGIYEAKWPRFKQTDYPWDYLHPTRLTSHFSEQINKKHIWQDTIATWEMFFNEEEYGKDSPPYEFFGSSCVWNNDAYNFMNSKGLILNKWSTSKLKELLKENGTNIYSIIFDLLSCKRGKKHSISAGEKNVVISSPVNDNIILDVPLPIDLEKEFDERIQAFMERERFTSYLYIVAQNIQLGS